MSKIIHQFGFKWFQPPEGVAVLDCRILQNPFKRGTPDNILIETVRALDLFEVTVLGGMQLLAIHDEIYVGCAFGKHRSGAVSQELAKRTGAIIVKG